MPGAPVWMCKLASTTPPAQDGPILLPRASLASATLRRRMAQHCCRTLLWMSDAAVRPYQVACPGGPIPTYTMPRLARAHVAFRPSRQIFSAAAYGRPTGRPSRRNVQSY